MRKMFVIPGFKQKENDKQFVWLKKFLIHLGFDVSVVPIKWERKTMSNYVVEFENFYTKNKARDNYVLGFSYGAVIAFITAEKLKPKKIFLCSLSPDFKEDIPHMKQWVLNYIGQNRIADLLTRSGKKIAEGLTVPTVVFYGEKEAKQYSQLKVRCEETVKLSKKAKLVVVKNASHNIAHPEYVKALKNEFNSMVVPLSSAKR